MTITAMDRALDRRRHRARRRRAARLGRHRADRHRVRIADPTSARCRRRDRRNSRPRPDGDARILAQSRGHAQHARERLAPHGRRRQRRRRRLPDAEGPLEGPHHQRRVEHLSARSRGGAAAHPACRSRGRRARACRSGARRSSPASWSAAKAADDAERGRARTRARRACASSRSPASSGPKAYHFVNELPKNNTGKVLKTVLRKRPPNAVSTTASTANAVRRSPCRRAACAKRRQRGQRRRGPRRRPPTSLRASTPARHVPPHGHPSR